MNQTNHTLQIPFWARWNRATGEQPTRPEMDRAIADCVRQASIALTPSQVEGASITVRGHVTASDIAAARDAIGKLAARLWLKFGFDEIELSLNGEDARRTKMVGLNMLVTFFLFVCWDQEVDNEMENKIVSSIRAAFRAPPFIGPFKLDFRGEPPDMLGVDASVEAWDIDRALKIIASSTFEVWNDLKAVLRPRDNMMTVEIRGARYGPQELAVRETFHIKHRQAGPTIWKDDGSGDPQDSPGSDTPPPVRA